MKKFTKLLGIVLIIALVMSMGTMAWADETTYGDTDGNNSGTAAANKGTVTVANAINGMTYDIYQILTLESFDDSKPAFAYKATTDWSSFINDNTIKGKYVTVNDDGYVQWITKKTVNGTETDKSAAELEAEAAEFAKLAIAYAEANNISNNGSATAANGTASFKNLPLGYYLVNSSAGALCSLDTTHLEVNIKEKNEVPTIEKKVEEDSKKTDGIVYDDNDADIGQVITYQTVINAKPGAQGYKLYDKMTKGLTFIGVTGITAVTGTTTVTLTKDTDYTVTTSGDYVIGIDSNKDYTPIDVSGSSNYANDDVTFLVTFDQDYLDTITADTTITVTYTAKLNENAVLNIPGTPELGNGNDNRTILEFGNKNFTEEDQTRTHTYDIGIFKYYVNGSSNSPLKGATFVMTMTAPGSTYQVPTTGLMAFKEVTEHQKYRYDVSATSGTITEITTDETGKFVIEGLDEGTYYLYEKEAPDGYNILSEPIIIQITSSTYTKTDFTSITAVTKKAGTDATKLKEISNVDSNTNDKEVGVLNQSGAVLPSTGGIGTTIFYVVGSIMVVAAGVLLITKKRMGRE